MLEKNDLLGVIETHTQNIRLVNILCVLTIKGDLSKSFYESIGEEVAKNPSFIKTFQLLENTDKVIHTANQLYLLSIRSVVSECYELTKSYSEKTNQFPIMEKQSWFHVIRILRNSINHDFSVKFGKWDKTLLPIEWGGILINESMENQELSQKIFPIGSALEWLEALETFINDELV